MRDLDRIKARKSYNVDKQKISIIFATGIIIGMTIFTVGLYLGLKKPGNAEAATSDPLDELIASGESAGVEKPDMVIEAPSQASLRYHELLGKADPSSLEGSLDEDVDAPMPVSADGSPVPMPSSANSSLPGSFKVPTVPSNAAFEEPPRIALPQKGAKGVYTVHVNSFTDKATAAGYVKQLRKAGYKAFLVEAHSVSRGTLYRVRIGPFYSHKDAWKFSKAFEKKEGVPTYIVQRILED